jgi:TolA-binding protein
LDTQELDDVALRVALLDAREGPSVAQADALARRVAERAAVREALHSEPRTRGRKRVVRLIGTAGLSLLLGALLWAALRDERALRRVSAPARPQAQHQTVSEVAAPPARPPVMATTAAKSAPPASQARAPRARTRQPARVVTPAQDEVPLLQQARRALLAHPDAALALARKHREQFPRGLFVEERASIEVEALWRLGQLREARQAWNEFVRRYPHSPYRQRLERLWSGASREL